jgi:hypothetical protein
MGFSAFRLFATSNQEEIERTLVEIKNENLDHNDIVQIIEKKADGLQPQHFNLLMNKARGILEDKHLQIQRAIQKGDKYDKDIILGTVPRLTSQIFLTSLSKISLTIDTLSKTDLVTCLSIIGKSRINLDIEESILKVYEDKILGDLDSYPVTDLITLVPYFSNMNYTPNGLLERINKEDNFITIPSNLIKDFLGALIEIDQSGKNPYCIKLTLK